MPSVRCLLPGLALGLAAPLLSAADAAPKSRDMDYVEVLGQRDNPYQVRSTTLGMKFAAETMRVPQSLQVFSAEGLRDQGVLDIGDVLKSVPSANAGQTRLAPFASFSWTIRGFDAAVTRNGFRQLYFEDVDQSAFSHVARVEVLKGPGSSLFGQEGLGGTINLVTKRPQATPAIELQGAFGEDDLATGTFDVTGPLVEGGALSARLTGEIDRSGSFVDFQDNDRTNTGFALAWDNGGRVRAFLNAEYMERNTQANPGLPVIGTVVPNGIGKVRRSAYLGDPDIDYLDTYAPIGQAWLDIELAEGWTLSPRLQYYEFHVHQQQMRLRGMGADNRTVNRSFRYDFHEDDDEFTAQLELNGRFATGAFAHQVLVGLQYALFDDKGDWIEAAGVPGIDVLAPVYAGVLPDVSGAPITFSNDVYNREVYVQDLVAVTPRFDLMGGFRYTNLDADSEFLGFYTNHEESNVTWNLGGSYVLLPGLRAFAGYGTALDIESVLGSLSRTGEPFLPEESEQIEAGLKWDLANGLTGSISGFEVTRTNVSTTDPVDPAFTIQVGEQRVRGVEIEAGWRLSPAWFAQAGYAYMDPEITVSNDGDEGNRIEDVARHQASAWVQYRFLGGPVAGLRLSGGVTHVGNRPGDNSNAFMLGSYTTMDLSAAYDWRQFTFELLAQNALDEEYYTQNNARSVYPGDPRLVFGRIRARF